MRFKSARFSVTSAQVTSVLSLLSLLAMVVGGLACERWG